MTDSEDDGLTCDCGHPWCGAAAEPKRKGWKGKIPVPLDGNNWPLDFAAKMIGCSEKDLRDLVRLVSLEPAGTLKMSSYRRSGRHPRAYDASKLTRLWQGIMDLAEDLDDENT